MVTQKTSMPARKRGGISATIGEKVFDIFVYVFLAVCFFIWLFPLLYVVLASVTPYKDVVSASLVIIPSEITLDGYRFIFVNSNMMQAFSNTAFITVMGTLISMVLSVLMAFPLSKKDLPGRAALLKLLVFTMYFSGGLIPTYMVVSNLKLTNTIWAMLLPGAISVYNMILVRTFLKNSIPQALLEVSQIDGCSDAKYFFHILLPLSKPVIAVITLYYAVGHWNAYFNAMMYLSDQELYPLQLILRQILVANQVNLNEMVDVEALVAKQGLADVLKYALIVVSTAPILCVYPFLQRFFMKGVMLGSVKG